MRLIKNIFKKIFWFLIKNCPPLSPIYYTRGTQTPVTWRLWFWQKIIGFNRSVYWPVHHSSLIGNWENIWAGVETCPGYMPGCYIQGTGKIIIGDYTQISCNVGIISANHDLYDNRKHPCPGRINIGEYCWIGMNATILPNVNLGDFTIVGAGSVVTHSFPDGYCVIAGNPAKIIKTLDKNKCVRHKSKIEYCGYIPKKRFDDFSRTNLNFGFEHDFTN
jgi:acetyltransferase-like isoleucine patch superfamily enzyme